MSIERLDRFRGSMVGLAVGDALGVAAEFKKRGEFEPIEDIRGGGVFNLLPGQWTDDTSMALCLAHSLIESGGFDPLDQMERYLAWRDEGYMSSTGKCFDIGVATNKSLIRFVVTQEPYCGDIDPLTAGNGSLMRLAPVPIFFHDDRDATIRFAKKSSNTTHSAPECVEACGLFAAMLYLAFGGASKEDILLRHGFETILSPKIAALGRGSYRGKGIEEIESTGYVVHTLEAALWCFYKTHSLKECLLEAANLGYDADTVAAVAGQLAGAFYGYPAIPADWRAKLFQGEEIQLVADRLALAAGRRA
ncbi:MAG: ADP-ribosylglycohydrolase family protein [bacterium]|nr:ADP-ribosylglycohydrolase family protein [bacterium]